MFIPRFWSRATDRTRACVGWSDASAAEAERMARERLAKVIAASDGATLDWDYYPSSPVKEEILETPQAPGATVVITRNRSGARVLNTDLVVFVDVDLPVHHSLARAIGSLFRKRAPESESEEAKALARTRAWADERSARVRVYRTARGLRLIRMDALLDPCSDECERMIAELAADRQYSRLCRVQKSFRARLTPKPRRVDCSAAPGSHPRTDPEMVKQFARWLEAYERASAGHAVCAFVAEYGSKPPVAAAQTVAALHDRYTLDGDLALA
jgi:hypothetical protein